MSREYDFVTGKAPEPVGRIKKFPVLIHLTQPGEEIRIACVGWSASQARARVWRDKVQELYDWCCQNDARLIFGNLTTGNPLKAGRLFSRKKKGELRNVIGLWATAPRSTQIRLSLLDRRGRVSIINVGGRSFWPVRGIVEDVEAEDRRHRHAVLLGRSILYGLNRYIDQYKGGHDGKGE